MYIEALSWMSYRYAIGVTEYPKRNGLSDVERYRFSTFLSQEMQDKIQGPRVCRPVYQLLVKNL